MKLGLAENSAPRPPSVLVLGDGDLMTPAAKAKSLAAAIAGSKTVVIPNSGHFMMVERPDETLEALKTLNGNFINLPRRAKDRPDRERLAVRYEAFEKAN